MVVVCDAAHLGRSLVLAAHVRLLPVRVVVALTMSDLAARRGVRVDEQALAHALGVAVVRIDPRRREVHALAEAVREVLASPQRRPLDLAPEVSAGCGADCPEDCSNCPPTQVRDLTAAIEAEDEDLAQAEALFTWVTDTTARVSSHDDATRQNWTDRIDRWATAPLVGPLLFLAVMWAVFAATTTVAAPLQDALDALFSGPVTDATTAVLGRRRPRRHARGGLRRQRPDRRRRDAADVPATDGDHVRAAVAARGLRLHGPRRGRDRPTDGPARPARSRIPAAGRRVRLQRAGDLGGARAARCPPSAAHRAAGAVHVLLGAVDRVRHGGRDVLPATAPAPSCSSCT